jgi:two-component system, LytTR family, sensor kinase
MLFFFHLPFFYFNAYFLIPRLLRDRPGLYLASILLLVIGMVLALRFFIAAAITVFALEVAEINPPFWPAIILPTFLFWAISTTYRLLIDYFAQERQRKEIENARLHSELSFLRSQISPHFIFNVLNSIVALARKKSDKVESVTLQLSELMRYMLYDSDEDQVPLPHELAYLQSYVDLQKLRFGQTVDVRFEVGEVDTQLSIEPMLLIPFVENAFKHGVGLIHHPSVEIWLATTAGHIHFRVKNKVAPRGGSQDRNSGIGLANVQRRLALLYPKAHQLKAGQVGDYYEVELELHANTHWPRPLTINSNPTPENELYSR